MVTGQFRKTVNAISNVAGYVSALAVVAAAGIITYEVIFRYLHNRPTIWEIETAVFLLIFAAFISAAYGLKHDAHIKIELLTIRLKPKAKALLAIFTDSFSFLFCAALTYCGWQMWWESYELEWLSESLWAPPLWIPYLFLPVGCMILCFQYILRIIDSINDYSEQNRKMTRV